VGKETKIIKIKAHHNDELSRIPEANRLIMDGWRVTGFSYEPATHISVGFEREVPEPTPAGKQRFESWPPPDSVEPSGEQRFESWPRQDLVDPSEIPDGEAE